MEHYAVGMPLGPHDILGSIGQSAELGLVGTAIRSHFAAPPRISPVVDVAVLMVANDGVQANGLWK